MFSFHFTPIEESKKFSKLRDMKKMFNTLVKKLIYKIIEWKKEDTYTIYTDGKPYLQRTYLKHKGVFPEILLHRFLASDDDRELHDHPWKWAVSFILAGGYKQEYRKNINSPVWFKFFRPGSINYLTRYTWHRVTLLDDEVWTLFIAGPRVQPWGFLKTEMIDGTIMSSHKVSWQEFNKTKQGKNFVLNYKGEETILPQ